VIGSGDADDDDTTDMLVLFTSLLSICCICCLLLLLLLLFRRGKDKEKETVVLVKDQADQTEQGDEADEDDEDGMVDADARFVREKEVVVRKTSSSTRTSVSKRSVGAGAAVGAAVGVGAGAAAKGKGADDGSDDGSDDLESGSLDMDISSDGFLTGEVSINSEIVDYWVVNESNVLHADLQDVANAIINLTDGRPIPKDILPKFPNNTPKKKYLYEGVDPHDEEEHRRQEQDPYEYEYEYNDV